MAIVQGIRERVHLPIYDSLTVEPGKQLKDTELSSILKFFVDVQKKTKLQTNLQSASLLPHYNTFEARAMRVVISDLPPVFSDKVPITIQATTDDHLITDLARAMELLELAQNDPQGTTQVRRRVDHTETEPGEAGTDIFLDATDIEGEILDLKESPPKEQIRNNGAGTVISKIIYNTVTTLYVGEKIMIQMPTWFFPAGAGPYSESGHFTTHGEPSPTATFRFAEPIFIDKQQNFRVELEIPDTDTLKGIQSIYGPMNVWVVLDGYMTRDVQ